MSARSPIDSVVATQRGDDGTTGLLYGGERVQKDDPRTEAYGTVDEAVAALGLARANLRDHPWDGQLPDSVGDTAELILRLQRELFVVGAELATSPTTKATREDGRTRVSEAMVEPLETVLLELEHHIEMPREFVVPGETQASAALELARTVIRRAERRAVGLRREGLLSGEHVVPYLNRLSDLVWVLARAAEQAESRSATPARRPAAGDRRERAT